MQDLGICGIWAGFRTPESGTLLNGSKQGRDVIGFTFSAAMWRTDWRGQEWNWEAQLEALQQWERERAAAGLREGAGRGRGWLDWESGLSVE